MSGYRVTVPELEIGDLCRKSRAASWFFISTDVNDDSVGVVIGKRRGSSGELIYTVWFASAGRTCQNVLPYEIVMV